ncbi:unnamed protein product [Ascophyllum nodosum]
MFVQTLSARSSSSSLSPPQVFPRRVSLSFRSLGFIALLSASLLLLLLGGLHSPQGAAAAGELSIMEISSQQYRSHRVDAGEDNRVSKFELQKAEEVGADGEPLSWRALSFREVAGLWKTSPQFAEMFAATLAAVPHDAIFWESIPVTQGTMGKPYEYVTVNSPSLARVSSDGTPFAEYLASGEGTTDVATFRNMRGDARLVSPCRVGDYRYAHLAAFVRSAPKEQVVKFFGAVGAGLEEELASRQNERPVWLSTSGLGVYWLHARLDSVPKYYTYEPYKTL